MCPFCLPIVLWPSLIKKYGGQRSDSLDISSLAKITDGYTQGHMVSAIQTVLTERRLKQVGFPIMEIFLIPQKGVAGNVFGKIT